MEYIMQTKIFFRLILFIFLVQYYQLDAKVKQYKIAVLFWHESLNDELAFKGIKRVFEVSGLRYSFDVKQSHSSREKMNEYLTKWKQEKVDLIFAMGTAAALAAKKQVTNIPIVFTAVTHPVLSNITNSFAETGQKNLTGGSNWIPTEKIVNTFFKVVPNMKTLGVVYNKKNKVSSAEVASLKESLKSKVVKLKMLARTADNIVEVKKQLNDLVGKIDALWIPIDDLIYKNIKQIKQITVSKKIPLLASSHRGFKDGAILGIVVDYVGLGKKSAAYAIKILSQKMAPHKFPIATMNGHKMLLNLKAAKEIDYEIPLAALAEADQFIKEK